MIAALKKIFSGGEKSEPWDKNAIPFEESRGIELDSLSSGIHRSI